MTERKICDSAGHELKVGDTICFTISMRFDQKPIVRAIIKEILAGGPSRKYGGYNDWVFVEYIESRDVRWGRDENKLPKKVTPTRVFKCY